MSWRKSLSSTDRFLIGKLDKYDIYFMVRAQNRACDYIDRKLYKHTVGAPLSLYFTP
jgi:hypothetical protein